MMTNKMLVAGVVATLSLFSTPSFADGVAIIDYNKVIQGIDVIDEYQKEVRDLEISILTEYNALDALRARSVDDREAEETRDQLVNEIAEQEAGLVKKWLVGLAKLNTTYDAPIAALDIQIQQVISDIMKARGLTVIQEVPKSGNSGQKAEDITEAVQKALDGGRKQ